MYGKTLVYSWCLYDPRWDLLCTSVLRFGVVWTNVKVGSCYSRKIGRALSTKRKFRNPPFPRGPQVYAADIFLSLGQLRLLRMLRLFAYWSMHFGKLTHLKGGSILFVELMGNEDERTQDHVWPLLHWTGIHAATIRCIFFISRVLLHCWRQKPIRRCPWHHFQECKYPSWKVGSQSQFSQAITDFEMS